MCVNDNTGGRTKVGVGDEGEEKLGVVLSEPRRSHVMPAHTDGREPGRIQRR